MSAEEYMRRAIELARRGAGWTSPNPMVGAVVVKNGRVIGEGAHLRCGQLHAERNALAACTEDPAGAVLYVTLEPCCHYGRTPPCTEIIIEKKLSKVVIGSRDPNPKVSGKGAAILREHGIEVVEDFLRDECDELNPVFFKYITTGKPYVAAKYAMTLDGKIATVTGASQWITGEIARRHVHTLRGRYAAILAGIGTVLADNPMLNCRVPGSHQPLRIIADSHLRIPLDSAICTSAAEYPTMVVCAVSDPEKADALEALGIRVVSLPGTYGKVDFHQLMDLLGHDGIDSIFIEGGGIVHEAVFRAGLVDHVYAYVAPKIFGGKDARSPVEGVGVFLPSQAALLTNQKITLLGEDILLEFDVKESMHCLQES